jgi:hypothetical protein
MHVGAIFICVAVIISNGVVIITDIAFIHIIADGVGDLIYAFGATPFIEVMIKKGKDYVGK